MTRVARKASGRLVGIRRRSRAGLLRSTALQAAVLVAIELPGGILRPAAAQPAPNARPQGGNVTAGKASISQSPTTTTIDQSSQRAAIDWNSFDVGRNQTVDFQQPSSSAWTLNRVTGPDPSQIAGRIEANGNIVLTNPSGVVFYRGSEVNAQSAVISAPGITNQNFMRGRMLFDQAAHANAHIINAGSITIKQAGLAALVAPQVVNSGVITAKLGHVLLAGATTHTLDMYGDGLLSFDVTGQVRQAPRGPDGKPVTALVTNTGMILADGGTVQLSARAADGIVQDLVDAKGKIETNTVGSQTGSIVITGTGGSIKIAGDLAANGPAPSAQGGQIELNATRNVVVGRNAVVDASGGAGGGTVAVGTTLARAKGGPSVTPKLTAARALIRPGATISADATAAGNGGKVTVLSKRATAMRGAITARGGLLGGDGGNVEISGERGFALTGTVNVGIRGAGELGTILLDPINLTIVNGDGTSDSFVNNGTLLYNQRPAQASVGNAILNAVTGDVVLQASHDLNVNASISPGGNVDLRAGHLLTVAGTVTVSGVNIRLDGGEDFSTGSVTGNGGVIVNGELEAFGGSPQGTIELHAGSLGVKINGLLSSGNELLVVATGPAGVQFGAQSNVFPFGAAVIDVSTVGGGGVTQAGINTSLINATTLQSSQGIAGNVSLPSTMNSIATLGNFAATGRLALFSGTRLDVIGTVTSGSTVSLTNLGTQSLSGVVTAPTVELTAQSFGDIIGQLTQSAGSIAGSRSVVLTAGDSIDQTGGVITAGRLSGSSGATTSLPSSGNTISNLGNFTSFGGFTLTDGRALTVAGPVTDNTSIGLNVTGALTLTGTVTAPLMSLAATGNITQNGGALVVTNELSGSSGGTTSLNSASNAIAALGSFTSTDDFSLASGGLAVAGVASVGTGHTLAITTDTFSFSNNGGGALTAPSGTVVLEPLTLNRPVDLGSAGGSGTLNILPTDLSSITASTLRIGSTRAGPVNIGDSTTFGTDTIDLVNRTNPISTLNVQTGGSITEGGILVVGTLTGSAAASVTLNNANSIATLGSFSAGGAFALTDMQPLTVAGPLDPTDVTLTASSLTITGLVSASGTVDLITNGGTAGSITEPTGTIVAAVLTGSSGASTSLTNSNTIGTLSDFFTAGGDFALTNTGNLVISGDLSVGSVDLIATGTISEALGAVIDATTLTGSAAAVTLDQTNFVSDLGTFASAGGFVLNNNETLSVTGSVSGTAIALTTIRGELIVSGTLNAPTIALTANGNPDLAGGDILQTGGSIAGSTSVVLTAFGSIDQSAGALSTANLSGSSGSTTSLPSAGNAIATLGSFSSTGGFALTDGQALTVAGPVTDTTSITISSAGALGASGDITAPTISLTTTAGGITQTAGTIGDTGTLGPNVVVLTAAGSIDQTGGVLIAGTLSGSSGGATGLPSAGNAVTNLGSFTSGGDFLLTDSVPVTIAATASAGNSLSSGHTLTIQDDSFTIGVGGALAATLGTIVLEPLTNGATFGLTGTQGALPFTANTLVLGSPTAGPVTISNNINLSGVSVLDVLSGGNISEAFGATLTVGELDGSAGGSASFNATNSIATLGSFHAVGDFSLIDAQALTVAGPVDPTNVTLIMPSITITGLVSASGTVDLVATTGAITEPGGTVDARVLTGSAATSISLTSASNTFGTVDGLTASGGNLSLTDSGDLVIFGAPSPSGALFGTTVDLVVAGTVSEAGTGQIIATDLIGSAGQANLTAPTNFVGQLGSFGAVAGFTLVDGEALSVTGPVSGSTGIALTAAGGLTASGTLTAPTIALTATASGSLAGDIVEATAGLIDGSASVVLTAAGSINQSGGILSTATLSGSSGGATTLPSAGNTVTNLDSFSSVGGFTLADGQALAVAGPVTDTTNITITSAGALTASGDITAPTIALTTTVGSITQAAGSIDGSTSVGLTAAGSIDQTGGVLIAGTLSGSSGGATSLPSAGNQVANLGGFTSSGDFFLADSVPVTIAASASAGNSLSSGHTLTIQDDSFTIGAGGALAVTLGTIVLEPLTNGGAFGLTGTAGALPFTANTLVLGSLTAGTVTISNNINLSGVSVLDVLSGGNISEAVGATLTVGELEGSAGGSASFGATNSIATLGSFHAVGDFSLVDAQALTVAGPVDPTNVTLNAPSLTITGLVSASGTVDLIATTGSIFESNTGTVDASVLTGSAATSISLTSASNTIGTVDGLTASAGNLSLTDSGGLVIGGFVSGDTVDLIATGTIGEVAGGGIGANLLTGSAVAATLGQVNRVAALGDFTTTSGFVLVNGETLAVVGSVTDGSLIALTSSGPLTVSGTVAAPTIDLTAVASLRPRLPGDILQTAGLIDGSTSVVLTAAGSIDQSSGALTAGTLSGSSGATTDLPSASNAITTLGSFTSTGGFVLTDGQALAVAGPVTDTTTSITISSAGALTASGDITAPTIALTTTAGSIAQSFGTIAGSTSVALTAAGSIDQSGGVLIAGTLSGSSGGATSLPSAGNQVANLGGFTSSGDFFLADGVPVNIAATASVGPGATLTIEDNAFTIGAAGVLDATPTGTIVLEPLTAGTPMSLTGTAAALPFIADTLVLGSSTAGPITIANDVNLANVGTLDVLSSGSVVEQAGATLSVGALEGAAGSASFTATNSIATLGSFTTAGGFALADAQALSVAGPVIDTSAAGITLDGNGPLAISGLLNAPTVGLFASGAITEPGGTIVTGTLSGSGPSISLTSVSNAIGTVEGLTATAGNLSLTDSGDLVIFGAVSAGGALSGTTVDLVVGGTVSEAGTGQIIATDLIGSAGQANLTAPTNFVGQLGSFGAVSGFTLVDGEALSVTGPVSGGTGIALTAAGGLTASGTLTAPTIALTATASGSLAGDIVEMTGGLIDGSTSVVLTAAGSIDQTGGILSTANLSGNSGAATTLPSAGNTVATLGSFSSGGGFALTDGEALAVAGPVTDTANIALNVTGALALGGTLTAPDVGLIASGAITQPSGAILASGTLSGSGAGVTLGQSGNQVTNLGGFTSSGDFFLADSVPVTLAGSIAAGNSLSSGHTLTLADNSFTIGAGGALAATLGTIVLQPLTPNTAFGLTGTAGSLPFTANTLVLGSLTSGPITIANDVNLSGVTVLDVLSGASIAEAAGTVLTIGPLGSGTLEGQAATTASFAATNSLATLAGFSATGGFTLVDAEGLTVSGPVIDPPGITLNVAGPLVISSLLSAPDVSLTATGAITEPGGTIVTGTLTGSGGAAVSLTNVNTIGTLDNFSAAGNFALTNTGDLVIAGFVSGDTVDLIDTGTITEVAGGGIGANLLTGSAVAATLGQANRVAALGDFTTTSGFVLVNGETLAVVGSVTDGSLIALTSSGPLTVSGIVGAPTVDLTAVASKRPLLPGDILQTGGSIDGSTSVVLTAQGSIDQSGGALTAATLSGSSGETTSLPSAGNAVTTLGSFTSTGGFVLTDGQALAVAGPVTDTASITITSAGALTASGDITAPTIALTTTAGSIAQTFGTIAGSTSVALTAAGSIDQSGGVLIAGTLSGSSGGATSLPSAGNQVANLGGFTSGGDFLLADSVPVNIAATASVGPGATLTIEDNAFTIGAAGVLDATPSGTIVLEPLTAGTPMSLTGTAAALPFIADTLVLGSSTAGPITIANDVNLANVGTLDVLSSGSVVEQAGATLSVGALEGAAGSASFTATNSITTLGSFTTTGGFALADAQALTVAGPVTDTSAAGVSLNVTGALTIGGPVNAPSVSLVATGAITEPGGTITTGTLSGSGASVALTSPSNAIGTLANFGANTGPFALTDSTDLVIAGVVFGATVDLVTGGTISEAATGSVNTPLLIGSAAAATLDQTNFVADLGSFASAGGFVLNNAEPLGVSGPVTAGTTIALTSIGPLSVSGSVAAPTVDLIALAGSVDGVPVAGNILQTGGSIDGSTSVVLTAAGSIDQSGGVLTTATLSGSSGATTNLPSAGNAVADLASFSSVGGFTLADGQALAVAGPVTDTTSITISSAGALTASGDITAPTIALTSTAGSIAQTFGTIAGSTSVALTAAGSIDQTGGVLIAGTLSGSSGGATSLPSGGNQVANLGGFTSGGDFFLADSVPVTIASAAAVSNGATLTIEDNQFTIGAAGVLSAGTSGTIVLEPLTPGTPFGLTGTPGALPFTANTLVLGSLTAGPITISNDVNLSGVAVLDVLSGAAIAEAGGTTLSVGELEGNGASASFTATNSIATLGSFTTSGGFALADTQALTVAGPVTDTSAAGVSLNVTGNLALAGPVNAPTLSLIATGAITEPGGSITAGTLTGTSGGATTLTGAGNAIANLGSFNSNGGFTLTDGRSLAVGGPLSDTASITLNISGGLSLAGVLTAPAVALNATGAITEPGGAISTAALSGTGASAVLNGANRVTALDAFSTSGGFALSNAEALTVAGPVTDTSAAGVALNVAGALAFAGNVSAPRINLAVAGAITQSSGILATGALSGTAASASLTDANTIASVGSFATTAGFSLTDAESLTIAGPLSDGSAVSLRVTGDLTLTGSLSAPTVQVAASGAFDESDGSISAGALSGSAGSVALGMPSNAIATLDGFNTSGDFALTDTPQLTIAGPLTSAGSIQLSAGGGFVVANTIAGAAVNLQSPAALVETGAGQVQTAVLTGAVARARLNGGNAIASLGDFAAPGGLALTNTENLTIAGAVNGGRAVALTVQGGGLILGSGNLSSTGRMALNTTGSITDQGGSIAAGTLTGSASGLAQFGGTSPTATASVGTLAAFTVSAGTLALADSVPLTITGPLSADDLGISATGSMTLVGGTIKTLGLPVAQQLGGQPAAPGSFLQVLPGPNGTGQFVQLGVTTIDPPNGVVPTLRIQVPDTGGSIVLNDLVGPTANLVLATQSGTMNGNIDVASLNVIGTTGSANLFGTVAGISGQAAAPISNITPAINNNYLLNLCVIMAPTCGGVIPTDLGGLNPELLLPDTEELLASTTASAAVRLFLLLGQPLIAAVAAECHTVGSLETLTTDCGELLLPNISDRDY